MRTAPLLLVALLLAFPQVPSIAHADDPTSTDANPHGPSASDYGAAPGEPQEGAAAETLGAPGPDPESDGDPPDAFAAPRSRRENRVKDHAIGLGYYYTHEQWNVLESGATPQVDLHSMAIRYGYYIGQAQRFGFMINAAAIVPMRASQSGVTSSPETNGTYNLLSTYDRHVGFDLSFMAGTHRMLAPKLAAIAGVGMHVGMLKLNDDELAIHEYIAIGAAGVFSLRYAVTEVFTVGADANVSIDFRDTVGHVSPLDYALNLGLTATVGLTFR